MAGGPRGLRHLKLGDGPLSRALRAWSTQVNEVATFDRLVVVGRLDEQDVDQPPPGVPQQTAARQRQLSTSPLRIYVPRLLDRLAAVDPERQRQVARFAARAAILDAGLDQLPGMPEALRALASGTALAAPFHSAAASAMALASARALPQTAVLALPGMGLPAGALLPQQPFAISAMAMATGVGDPLLAAICATRQTDPPGVTAEFFSAPCGRPWTSPAPRPGSLWAVT